MLQRERMMIPCHIPSLGSVAEEDVTKGSSERRLKFEGLEAYASSDASVRPRGLTIWRMVEEETWRGTELRKRRVVGE